MTNPTVEIHAWGSLGEVLASKYFQQYWDEEDEEEYEELHELIRQGKFDSENSDHFEMAKDWLENWEMY